MLPPPSHPRREAGRKTAVIGQKNRRAGREKEGKMGRKWDEIGRKRKD
jgi:hypothetical protein